MVKAASKLALVVAVLALTLVFAASAFALTNTATTTQVSPGVMQRVIWGQTQNAQYPVQVTHAGDLHVELNWNPYYASNFLNVFIWDGDTNVGQFVIENINQGWVSISPGKCVVDYWVPDVSTQGKEVIDPDGTPASGDEHYKGDTYTIIVVSYDDWNTRFHVSGYASQTDLTAGTSVTSENDFFTQTFDFPKKGTQRLVGVPYGYPFDFKATSAGEITTDLQYPADVKTKTVTYDAANASAPAVWEQYLYAGANWDAVMQDYLTSSPSWWPNQYGTAPNNWWGLHDTVTVSAADQYAKPNLMYHYYPDLALVAGDAAQGPFAPLATGVQTMGYKATITYPCNLVLASAPGGVMTGAKATFKGTFALNGAWVAQGTTVQLQFLADGSKKWVTKGTAKVTDANGNWSGTAKVMASGKWRASATGDAGTGLAVEVSNTKAITAN